MTLSAVAVDAGELPLGGGLLTLLRPALLRVAPGGLVAVLSRDRAARDDLQRWCQVEHHGFLGSEVVDDRGTQRHLIERGRLGVPRPEREAGLPLALQEDGHLLAATVLDQAPFPEHADPHTGFAPRGAQVEPGGPPYPVSLLDRAHVAPPDVARLYDQAVAAQWDASRDIAWSRITRLPDALEWSVGQLMTFLAENELSALYVPSKFIPRLHPHFAEVGMFLATQVADEARHIDVFLKRARVAGGSLGVSSVTTSHSLLSLLQIEDFTEAEFMLSVLGEGTFIDLLRFVERHAPDEPTFELVRRARADEARHVHFGLSHVRHALAHDAGLYGRLEQSVRRRAATMSAVGGVPTPIQDALVVLAAGGDAPDRISRGHEAFRELLHEMHDNRMHRLEHAGFSAEQARTLSELHTPNFM